MGNMSYCRFRNTLLDLVDCWEDLKENNYEELLDDEKHAAIKLIKICMEISKNFDGEDLKEIFKNN